MTSDNGGMTWDREWSYFHNKHISGIVIDAHSSDIITGCRSGEVVRSIWRIKMKHIPSGRLQSS